MKKLVILVLGILLSSVLLLIALGYIYKLEWVGVVDLTTGRIKSLWDWMELLIVPLMLAAGGWWLSHLEKTRSENVKRTEMLVVLEQQRQDSLQKFIEYISSILLDNASRSEEEKSMILVIARSQTLATLKMLDGVRKGILLQFLFDSGLISENEIFRNKQYDLLDIRMADLSNAILDGGGFYSVSILEGNFSRATFARASFSGSNLWEANFTDADMTSSEFISVNLTRSTFHNTKMVRSNASDLVLKAATISNSDLSHSLLHEAHFEDAHLTQTKLADCILNGADFSKSTLIKVNLSRADLSPWLGEKRTSFREAKLTDVNFTDANLAGVDFTGAQVDIRSLKRAKLLDGVILPDGKLWQLSKTP